MTIFQIFPKSLAALDTTLWAWLWWYSHSEAPLLCLDASRMSPPLLFSSHPGLSRSAL